MVYLTPVSLAASAGSGGSAGENPPWKKLRCGGSIPVASSGPSALGIRFTGDEASWSPRAPGQHGWASTGAAAGSSRGLAGCAASPARSPTETRCCRCQQLSPSIPIQLRGEPSHRGDLMAGEAGPGRSEPAAARHGTARRRARLQPGLGSGPAGYFRGEAVAKFSSRAWCLPRDEFIGIGQLWFARLWLSGSP